MNATRVVTNNLDKIIDINFYPVEETRISNTKHRPLGIGVQGLADVYALFKYPFDSQEAKNLNKEIFAAIYYAACEKSMLISKNRQHNIEKWIQNLEITKEELVLKLPEYYDKEFTNENAAIEEGYHKLKPLRKEIDRQKYMGSYVSFDNSPISQGIFQFNMWNVEPVLKVGDSKLSWNNLRKNIGLHGMRNSLLSLPCQQPQQVKYWEIMNV